jgi:hypothetical protein
LDVWRTNCSFRSRVAPRAFHFWYPEGADGPGGNSRSLPFSRDRRGFYFSACEPGINDISGQSFCVGSRIHGTISGVLAGTPALLIGHDARTLELRESMRLRPAKSPDLNAVVKLPFGEMIEAYRRRCDFPKYRSCCEKSVAFLRVEGLAVTNDSASALSSARPGRSGLLA